MKQPHRFDYTVQIFDTDCFGVVWHGAYTQWLEMARVAMLEAMNLRLSKPTDTDGYIYPVVEQRFRFLAPGKMQDQLSIATTLLCEEPRLVFHQEIHPMGSDRVLLDSTTVCVVVDMAWKMQKRFPDALRETLLTPS